MTSAKRIRRWATAAAAAVSAALASVAPSSPANAAEEVPQSNVVQFRTELRGRGGVVRCGLFRESGWLKKPVGADVVSAVKVSRPICVFRGVPAGTYGLSAFHDENDNGKLDTNFIGMPIEDYCASNNARGVLGPPSFADAKFSYRGGTLRVEAKMK